MHRSGFFKIFLILSAISLLLDWYVFKGLRTFTNDWQSRRGAAILPWGFLIISVGLTLAFLFAVIFISSANGMTGFHAWTFGLFLTFFVTKLVFAIVLLLGDIGRSGVGIANAINKHKDSVSNQYFPARRKFISELAILLASFPFLGFFYAMFRGKYDYRVHRQTIYYDELPEAFDGFTITQLSDIHAGSFDNTNAMQKGIDLAQAQKSDLFVFTGDLVNNLASEIKPYISNFSKLRSPCGQFSILGNHDYGDYIQWESEAKKDDNLEQLKQHHKELGFRLLLDENIELEKNGQKISLIGIQNWGKGFVQKGNLSKAMQGVDENSFKILLSHDPSHWEEQVRNITTDIHLTLSGHTHGAQFGVETDGFRWSPVQYRYLNWAGLVHQKNRYLYVNRGFGFIGFSGRLGIWPEITVITLKKKH
ncbi:MAG: metallophosphoesterase [Bacteroidota bacterium]